MNDDFLMENNFPEKSGVFFSDVCCPLGFEFTWGLLFVLPIILPVLAWLAFCWVTALSLISRSVGRWRQPCGHVSCSTGQQLSFKPCWGTAPTKGQLVLGCSTWAWLQWASIAGLQGITTEEKRPRHQRPSSPSSRKLFYLQKCCFRLEVTETTVENTLIYWYTVLLPGKEHLF